MSTKPGAIQLAAQLAELEALKGSSELQAEIQFETKLRDLLAEYGYSLRDIINILDPQANRRAAAPAACPVPKPFLARS